MKLEECKIGIRVKINCYPEGFDGRNKSRFGSVGTIVGIDLKWTYPIIVMLDEDNTSHNYTLGELVEVESCEKPK